MNWLSSLRIRLLLLVLLTVLPGAGLLLHAGEEQGRAEADEVRMEALSRARVAAAAEQQLIDETHHLLITAAQVSEVHGDDPEACRVLLAKFLGQYPMLTNLLVLEADGRLFASGVPPSVPDYHNLAWFKRAIETRAFGTSGFATDGPTGAPVMAAVYPEVHEDGRVHRLIAASLDLTWMRRAVAVADLPNDAVVTVIDGNGLILAREPDNGTFVGHAAPEWRVSAMARSPNGEGTVEGLGLDGVTRLYGYSRLKSADVFVSVGLSRSIAYAAVNKTMVRNLLLLAAATLVTCGLAWGVGQAVFVRPVSRLAATAKQLASGDLSARVNSSGRRNELQDLAVAFDHMADSLQEQQARLARQNRLFRVLSKIDEAIVRVREPQKLYEEACRVAVEEGSFRMAWVGLVDPKDSWVKPVAWAGVVDGYLECIKVSADDSLPEGQGPTGVALRTGRIVSSVDVRIDRRRDRGAWRPRSAAIAPLQRCP